MKKILIIPSWYPNVESPLLGSFFQEQALLLNEDFEVRVLANVQRKKASIFKKLLNTISYFIFNRITVNKINGFYLQPPLVYEFEYSYGIMFNYNIRLKAYLSFFEKEILGDWKPDLIHAHDTFMGGVCAQAISEKWNIPYIIMEHNYLLFNKSKRLNALFTSALNNAKAVLLVSEYQKRILLLKKIGNNFYITGNYVNEQNYKLSRVKTDAVFNILWVGGYAHHKDFITLLKTIKVFSGRVETGKFCFHIVGEIGKANKKLMEELGSKIMNTNCIIYGNIGREDIAKLFGKMDVLMSTSIAETFGVAICEAMMCGIPVVSTNNGGFDEMYIEGLNGIKCNLGDSNALANALFDIYNGRFKVNAEKIRESVLNKFGSNAFKLKITEAYKKIIESHV